MSGPRRVLVVSFFYPPDPAVGGRRVAGLVRYLPESGWSPTVLTAGTVPDAADRQSDERAGQTGPTDPALVHATRFWRPFPARRGAGDRRGGEDRSRRSLQARLTRRPVGRFLYAALRHALPLSSVRMPDATLGWVPFAVREGRRLLARARYDAILSSAGPPSSHRVASRLARESGVPWVADYRDLWSDNHWDRRIPPFRAAERMLERRTLSPARAATTVTPGFAERLAALLGKPTEVVYNGYDPDDYPADARRPSEFTLTYVGSLYAGEQDPGPIVAAIRRLEAGNAGLLEAVGFRLRFVGTDPAALERAVGPSAAARWLERVPAVPYADSLRLQSESAALLYIGWPDPSTDVLGAKLFEYLGAGRPVLAIGRPGDSAARILAECGLTEPTEDPDRLAATLSEWLRAWKATGEVGFRPNAAAAARYTRRAQTARAAAVLDRSAAPV